MPRSAAVTISSSTAFGGGNAAKSAFLVSSSPSSSSSLRFGFPFEIRSSAASLSLPHSFLRCGKHGQNHTELGVVETLQNLWNNFLVVKISKVSGASMDGSELPSLYPLHRSKTIHLVRHAQGIHNVEGDKNYKAYLSPEYFDAQLTPLGWQQVDNLRKHVQSSGLFKKIDLVVTSPLMRTMQTAVGVFGGDGYTDRMDILPLMVANAGHSNRAAISSLNCPPIVALELCREHLGVHPCDRRRSISEYQCLFPAIDFSLIETDEDTLWKANIRETKEEVAARGMNFMKWLWTRKEKEIAIVTHRGYLSHTLKAFGNDCHPLVKKEISKPFANCELRSMVIVDRSMIGSDASATDYPGRIPFGPDLSSDVADEKDLENGGTGSLAK